jgi:hypothetical protein
MVNFYDDVATIFPRFVFHRKYQPDVDFHKGIYDLATSDAIANRTDGTEANAIGSKATHLSHLRHNFLDDCKHPYVLKLINMADESVRAYLKKVYNYDHTGELEMMSDTFWQQRERGENVGINCHTHFTSHVVVTYYVRVDRDPKETNPLRMGSVRFYDPQHVNTRPWPNNNKQLNTTSWYNVIPEEGSMVVFEGFMPHDSTYFDGESRLCIPIMVNLVTPRTHIKKSVSELIRKQKIL